MRIIGIRPRVKRTAKGVAHPTQVWIVDDREGTDSGIRYELADPDAELDFVRGKYPIAHRALRSDDDLEEFADHHIKWRDLDLEKESSDAFPPEQVRGLNQKIQVVTQVPAGYDGLQPDDRVVMLLGGSGDNLAYALTNRGQSMQNQARVFRIPPAVYLGELSRQSEAPKKRDKNQDPRHLVAMFIKNPKLFYPVQTQEMRVIQICGALRVRQNVMQDRIACGQRILTREEGQVFLSEAGFYPEGTISDQFEEILASNEQYQALLKEEAKCDRELAQACEALPLYQAVFRQVPGIGPAIAARLIAAIIDIRRFWQVPDPEKMNQLYEQSRVLEEKAGIGDYIEEARRLITVAQKPGDIYHLYRKVAELMRADGKAQEAGWVMDALRLHQQRAKLRRQAHIRGRNKLRAFCGTHLILKYRCLASDCQRIFDPDDYPAMDVPECPFCESAKVSVHQASFPKRGNRGGKVCNWSPVARQALYLLGEQFNRRPNTPWGQRLLHNKTEYRRKHPEVVVEGEGQKGRRKYTPSHIHKMAIWKTLGELVEWLFDEWTKFERDSRRFDPDSKSAGFANESGV